MRLPQSVFSVVGSISIGLIFVPATGFAQPADAESWVLPRMANGRPNLQGVWSNNAATPLERPESLGDQAVLTDDELAQAKARYAEFFANGAGDAAFADRVFTTALGTQGGFSYGDNTTGNYNQFWLADREFDHRTSLIVDPPNGRLPSLTPSSRLAIDARTTEWLANPASSYTDRRPQERCITVGMPNLFPGYNTYFQILQTSDYVVFLHEMIHDARIIPIGYAPHINDSIRQWHGDPRGYWDNDTLVVETTNFSAQAETPGGVFERHRGSAKQVRLTERFTRMDLDTIEHRLTVDDPGNYEAPWTAIILLKRNNNTLFEYACHEGNIAMAGILAGQRAEEHKTTEK